ncbi:MAG: transcriptional repressor NrdR [Actinobacteria bacterium]|nr:MAG: transcriptional repressor NrdR [Actinomycetota bacterium]
MKCQICGHEETKVIDSRTTESADAIRRRRECLKCTERFTTYERIEEIPLMVIKKDNSREPFNRSKLMAGLVRAVTKREVSNTELDKLITDIEKELRNQFKYEVEAKDIGDMVLKRLKDIDKVAYIRFASVYKDFQDAVEFSQELTKLR